ncbi:hypothetical protein ACFVIM_13705 [Streptomyces sp. NPDC057638]|uniref:hypothetical protein n=1 Tax=Streptomyces sp. NPDC057638 TaxID=3346190 RepID=UPI003677EAF5
MTMLARRDPFAVARIDTWMARALADRSGALADDTVRTAVLAALPDWVRSHAALLQALTTTRPSPSAPGVGEELALVGEPARGVQPRKRPHASRGGSAHQADLRRAATTTGPAGPRTGHFSSSTTALANMLPQPMGTPQDTRHILRRVIPRN